MNTIANVAIDSSQFPENVRRDLLASLRSRRVNHKFHYDSFKQTQKWLALHEVHSPARQDQDCLAIYESAFEAVASKIKPKRIHVIGLGCGGGQKDVRLLKLLKAGGKKISYAPCDVSVAMTLVARKAALKVLPADKCFPFVCDLATGNDLPAAFHSQSPVRDSRVATFFGMIPNFEPLKILPKLAALVRPKDFLLFSANLAPGDDYAAGVKKIMPQYDNVLTHDWLLTFLLDLGMEPNAGKIIFTIENGGWGLKRVVARFHFQRTTQIKLEAETFHFQRGESLRLFFSYRYTPELVRKTLVKFGLKISGQWVANSGEEGVFLMQRSSTLAGHHS